MSNRLISRKRTIIEQHQAFFDSLEKLDRPKPAGELFPERKNFKVIEIPKHQLDYQGEANDTSHNKTGGFKSTPIFNASMLDFRPFQCEQVDFNKLTGGIPLPDGCEQILRKYEKLRKKTQKYRNPKRSIMKELKRKNNNKAKIIKKNITLEFK